MISPHRIPCEQFAALASGRGGPSAIRTLWSGQLSKHLLLIRFLAKAWPAPWTDRDRALTVLTEAQSRAAHVVNPLLAEPMVGSWAAHTARRIRDCVKAGVPLAAELGHLGAIAAAAAVRVGLDADLTAYVRDGWVSFPTLGRARMPLPDFAPVRVGVRAGIITITGEGRTVVVAPGRDTDAWQGLRRLSAGEPSFSVALDDLDPYRDRYHAPASPRLSEDLALRWQELFAETWRLLSRHAASRAAELAAGLRSMVPLTDAEPGAARSATVRDAVGTFGLTLPASAADLAVTLVHEFQHSKLGAILDLVRLYDASGEERYFAPWRTDPRPLGGLFQGVYAFLGVADVWRLLCADPLLRPVAERHFADVREQVDDALTTLADSGRLTPAGHRFAAGMRESLGTLRAVAVPTPSRWQHPKR